MLRILHGGDYEKEFDFGFDFRPSIESVFWIVKHIVRAEEKKKNFRFEPTKFAAKTAGVDVQFVVFALDPGAMFKDFKVGQNEYLIVTKGEFVYTYGGKTMTKKVGDNWYHPAGTILTVTNKGNDESILLAIQGVPDKR